MSFKRAAAVISASAAEGQFVYEAKGRLGSSNMMKYLGAFWAYGVIGYTDEEFAASKYALVTRVLQDFWYSDVTSENIRRAEKFLDNLRAKAEDIQSGKITAQAAAVWAYENRISAKADKLDISKLSDKDVENLLELLAKRIQK